LREHHGIDVENKSCTAASLAPLKYAENIFYSYGKSPNVRNCQIAVVFLLDVRTTDDPAL
jgi:hypothetical protein